MKFKVDVKFDDKKLKSAIIREAEKAAEKKIAAQKQAETQVGSAACKYCVCKHCNAKFFAPIESGICPNCQKPLD